MAPAKLPGEKTVRLGAANREHLVVAVERIAGLEIPARRLRSTAVSTPNVVLPSGAGQLRAGDRIDDAPRVDGGAHVAVAAADAGEVEECRRPP